LLRFFFLGAFFGHGLRSSEDGCAADQHCIIPRCETACPQAERNTGIRAFCRLGTLYFAYYPIWSESRRKRQALYSSSQPFSSLLTVTFVVSKLLCCKAEILWRNA